MSNIVPMPLPVALFAEPAGRPGDWWESVPVTAAELAANLRVAAHRRRLPLDLLAALLVEGALVMNDIADCGLDMDQARAALNAAGNGFATTGPGRLHTPYVRMLSRGERDYERESDAQLARRGLVLPLRLHDAARGLELRELCNGESLDEAIAWEIAAAASGLFMREWALRTLLAQTTSRPALA